MELTMEDIVKLLGELTLRIKALEKALEAAKSVTTPAAE